MIERVAGGHYPVMDCFASRTAACLTTLALAAGAVSCEEPLTCTSAQCVPLLVELRFASADNEPGEEVEVDIVTEWGEATFTCTVEANGFFSDCRQDDGGITMVPVISGDVAVLEFTIGRFEEGDDIGPRTVEVTARVGDEVLLDEAYNPTYEDHGEINGEGCGRCESAPEIVRDIERP